MGRSVPLAIRFWAKVDIGKPEDCWPWGGAVNAGYGEIWIKEGRRVVPHRLAWELAYGPVPPGHYVLSTCHNRLCCNPAHLRTATTFPRHGGSHLPGERHPMAKLTDDEARVILQLWEQGDATMLALGRFYGVAQQSIARIIHGVGWTHIERPKGEHNGTRAIEDRVARNDEAGGADA